LLFSPWGFAIPGTSKEGDLPPIPECEDTWRTSVLSHLQNVEITLVLGRYAQNYHFNHRGSLTELVESWQTFWPDKIPLPHPSPRNNRWLKKNPWFVTEFLPELQVKIAEILAK